MRFPRPVVYAVLMASACCQLPTELPADEVDFLLLRRGPQENPYDQPLVTDRPDFTEASSTVGRGVVQLETGYTYIYHDDAAAGEITQSHVLPELLFRIGVADPIELRIGWTYAWEEVDAAGSSFSSEGGTDLYLGLKLALFEQNRWRPEQAIIIESTSPTGAEQFSTHQTEFGLNYLYSWELPNEWSLAGSTGFGTDNDVGNHCLIWHQSVALGIPLTERIGTYIEYFGLYSYGSADETREHYLSGGFTWLVNYNVQFDFRAGKGLSDDSDDFFTGIGGAFRF